MDKLEPNDLEMIEKMTDVLCKCLPFIEDAKTDTTYKPGVVAAMEKEIKQILQTVERHVMEKKAVVQ